MGEKIMDGFPTREQALADFFEKWDVVERTELVTLDDSVGRVLAKDQVSLVNLPVVRASGCDGIAVHSADFANGLPDTSTWQYGRDYVRADTGDDFPDEFDAVIMIEKAAIQPDGSVVLDDDVQVKPNGGVRDSGSNIAKGDPILAAGNIIRPIDVAALCMGGISMVPVCKRPVVAFIPTGSELVSAGTEPKRGQMIDCNSLLVKHMLIEYGAEPLIFPIVRDNPEALEAAFAAALEAADFVIVNGGSAVGDEDFNVRMIEARGQVVHHYIAAAPGRPLMMAVADGKPVIDLPGPTAGAFYGTTWCVNAVVSRMLGIPVRRNQVVRAVIDADYSVSPKMAMLARWNVRKTPNGLAASPFHTHRNAGAMLTSNALRVSPIGEKFIPAGSEIEIELLRGMEWIPEANA